MQAKVKANNDLSNLEWVTHRENIQHSYDVLGRTVKSGKDHHNYGKTQSEESKKLMSEAKQGEKHYRFKGYYSYGRYESTSLNAIRLIPHAYEKTL